MGKHLFTSSSSEPPRGGLAHSASLWLAIMIGLVFVGDRILSLGFRQILLDSKFRYSVLYKGKSEAQVLIIGNSRALNCCYSPAIQNEYGISAMNIAYNGMPLKMAAALISDYYDRNVPPKVLIVEATSLFRGNYSKDLYLFAAISQRLREMFKRDLPERLLAEKIMHLQTYNRETFLRVLYYLKRSDQDWIDRYKITEEMIQATREMPQFAWENDPENVAALKEIIDKTNRFGTRLVVIVAPYLPEYVAKVKNYDAWLSTLKAIVGGSASVYDYSRVLTNLDLFADRVHLNESGSRRLLEIMNGDGIFCLQSSK